MPPSERIIPPNGRKFVPIPHGIWHSRTQRGYCWEVQSETAFGFSPPAQQVVAGAISLWATYYRVYRGHAVDHGQPLLDEHGQELGPRLSVQDFCLAAIEGTVGVIERSGRTTVYNYAGRGN